MKTLYHKNKYFCFLRQPVAQPDLELAIFLA